jgi:glycosyltransferase involved in cell wall biosynthesis
VKVIYLSPSYFDETSVIGGAERYAMELASKVAKVADTTLISFSDKRQSSQKGQLKVELYPVRTFLKNNKSNPFSLRYLENLRGADIVHMHNIYIFTNDLSCLLAHSLGKKTYVTDHACGTDLVLSQRLPVFDCYTNAIAYSQFAKDNYPEKLRSKTKIIRGGVDIDWFHPDPSIQREKKIIFSGRVVAYKGIDYLIEAFRILNRPDFELVILGRVYDQRFASDLHQMAQGLNVRFESKASQEELRNHYRSAMVTVLPTVHRDRYGGWTVLPELMGLVLLESMACGTPVICSDAGAMHEFVQPGQTGYVVPQNNPAELAVALDKLISLPASERLEVEKLCLESARSLGWSRVVAEYLDLYGITAS